MTGLSARAFWTVGRERGEIRTEALPVPRAGEVLVHAIASGISRGSELLVFRGCVPQGERSRMRAPHQAGEFPWPVKYGYSSVGRVAGGRGKLAGREVFCLYPHQDRYVVSEDALVLLPDGLPASRAVLAANMETALNATWDARLGAGDRVAVVGAGVVGMLVAYLAAQHPGTEVALVDIDPRKRAAAEALGLRLQQPEHVASGADVVFHATGNAEGLAFALGLAGCEARVVELSWYGEREVTLPLGAAFHSQRLRLVSSQVGGLPGERVARWTHRRRLALALGLLLDPRLDALTGEVAPFERLPEVMARLSRGTEATLCHRIEYASGE